MRAKYLSISFIFLISLGGPVRSGIPKCYVGYGRYTPQCLNNNSEESSSESNKISHAGYAIKILEIIGTLIFPPPLNIFIPLLFELYNNFLYLMSFERKTFHDSSFKDIFYYPDKKISYFNSNGVIIFTEQWYPVDLDFFNQVYQCLKVIFNPFKLIQKISKGPVQTIMQYISPIFAYIEYFIPIQGFIEEIFERLIPVQYAQASGINGIFTALNELINNQWRYCFTNYYQGEPISGGCRSHFNLVYKEITYQDGLPIFEYVNYIPCFN